MARRRGAGKPSVAIEHADGEPITRADIQFDLLSHIFSDETKAFSDPASGTEKLSFRDLYVNAILRSPKAKSVLREKLETLPTFATDFAMLALLTNVGRIAATMSFFAEMRTAQRTYHPIPSLQRTNGNLLDAPRIKAILKTSILEGLEGGAKNGIATPAQVLARIKAGQIPPATLPNLIFVFANHSAEIGKDHLSDMDFLDLFLPNPASSASRARVFLWLCYHYHEGPSIDPGEDRDADVARENPFSDPSSPGKAPSLVMLTPDEVAVENLDPEDEKALANRLIAQREAIVQDHLLKESTKESKAKAESASGETPSPSKPKRQRANAKAGPSVPLKRKAPELVKEEEPEIYLKKLQRDDDVDLDLSAPQLRAVYRSSDLRSPIRESTPPPPPSWPFPVAVAPPEPYSHRYSPYKRSRPRTMLQHAWHVIATSDPLADSDEDDEDEHVRQDHAERLAVISRVRGKAPTPEPEGVRPIPLHLGHWHDDLFAAV
ncbi:Ino eighty subunit 1 [Mycena venus]|uniref:Ino eighty subunit 1 n=1 Tax=Mycena venus TaxID=2733690 RepID=A0A8H6XGC3_9AGAR|nr:Ino eighty subunit 1 [Mycena venus]